MNKLLRLHVAYENSSETLVILTTFTIKVFASMLFKIKSRQSASYSVQHLHQSIALSRYLSIDPKDIMKPFVKDIGFLAILKIS